MASRGIPQLGLPSGRRGRWLGRSTPPQLPRARERRRVNTTGAQNSRTAGAQRAALLSPPPPRRKNRLASCSPSPGTQWVLCPRRLNGEGGSGGTAGSRSRPPHLRLRGAAAPRPGASPLRLPPPPLLLGAVSLSPLARPFPPQPRLPRLSRCSANCWFLLRCCRLILPVSCRRADPRRSERRKGGGPASAGWVRPAGPPGGEQGGEAAVAR